MPNRRDEGEKGYTRYDRVNDEIRSTLTIAARMFMVYEIPVKGSPDRPAIMLGCHKPLSKMELTVLTEPELEALRKFFNDLIDRALPISQALDADARAAAEAGDTRQKRLWRTDPVRRDFEPSPRPPRPGDSDAE